MVNVVGVAQHLEGQFQGKHQVALHRLQAFLAKEFDSFFKFAMISSTESEKKHLPISFLF